MLLIVFQEQETGLFCLGLCLLSHLWEVTSHLWEGLHECIQYLAILFSLHCIFIKNILRFKLGLYSVCRNSYIRATWMGISIFYCGYGHSTIIQNSVFFVIVSWALLLCCELAWKKKWLLDHTDCEIAVSAFSF